MMSVAEFVELSFDRNLSSKDEMSKIFLTFNCHDKLLNLAAFLLLRNSSLT